MEYWVIYGQPIPGSVVGNGETKAVRIGYMESKTVSF